MPTVILIVFAIALAVSLVVGVTSLIARERDRARRPAADPTPAEREQNRSATMVWLIAAISIPVILVMLYAITR